MGCTRAANESSDFEDHGSRCNIGLSSADADPETHVLLYALTDDLGTRLDERKNVAPLLIEIVVALFHHVDNSTRPDGTASKIAAHAISSRPITHVPALYVARKREGDISSASCFVMIPASMLSAV